VQRAIFLFFLEGMEWHRTGRHAARRVSAPVAPENSEPDLNHNPGLLLRWTLNHQGGASLQQNFPRPRAKIWSGLAQIRLSFGGGS
jgi:hypothetical protein